jgi:hypothetical protein
MRGAASIMLERYHIADFQDWTVCAPNGCTGVVFSLYNVVTGGDLILKCLRGCNIRDLPPGYHAELSGTTHYEDGLKKGCASWKG